MNKPLQNLICILLILLSLGALGGAGVLLWRSLPAARPEQVDALETNSVFVSGQSTVQPEREKPFEGMLPVQDDLPGTSEPEQEEESDAQAARREAERRAQALLDTMTLEQKVWQMFFVTPENLTGVNTATIAGEKTKQGLADCPVGGIIYFADNLEDRTQARALLSGTQDFSQIPLFLGTDEEGGAVSRVASNPALGGVPVDPMGDYGAKADPAAVYTAGAHIARALTDLGFNMDFAPVVDVAQGAGNVIGSRSFGQDAELVAALGGVMVNSLRDHGILPCLKHFPGYGSAVVDDHNGTSVVRRSMEELESCDLIPFRTILSDEQSVPFVMVSHLSFPDIVGDDTPADLSPAIVTDLLRNKLQFQNVIITDSHQMSSITDHYSSGDAALAAVRAGCDMILMPEDLESAGNAILTAVQNGQLTEARIDQSVLRILTVKALCGLLDDAA